MSAKFYELLGVVQDHLEEIGVDECYYALSSYMCRGHWTVNICQFNNGELMASGFINAIDPAAPVQLKNLVQNGIMALEMTPMGESNELAS